MNWSELERVVGFPEAAMFAPGAKPISEDVLELEECVYAYLVPHDHRLRRPSPDALFVSMVLWAESPGAALRALSRDLEADVRATHASPPAELLPGNGAVTYREILAALRAEGSVSESATYRIATDGLFVHKEITTRRRRYLFRNLEKVPSERPFAIAYRFVIPPADAH